MLYVLWTLMVGSPNLRPTVLALALFANIIGGTMAWVLSRWLVAAGNATKSMNGLEVPVGFSEIHIAIAGLLGAIVATCVTADFALAAQVAAPDAPNPHKDLLDHEYRMAQVEEPESES